LESLAVRVALGEALTVKLVGAHAGRGAEPVAAPSEVEPPTPPPPAKVRSVLIPEKVVWPPTPAEILEVLEQTGWTLKDAARRLGKRDATLSRFLKKTFGGLSAAKKAGRVWKATGRIPRPDQVDAAFALVQATPTAAALRAQRRWARDGELEPS
jgi:hypothetical protein